MAEIDIKIDDPFNEFGDFNLKNSDYQTIQAIVLVQKGQFYQWPTVGVAIRDFFNSPDQLTYLRTTISDELAKDNYDLIEYSANITQDGTLRIKIDAEKAV